jgi:hypothetical protein
LGLEGVFTPTTLIILVVNHIHNIESGVTPT